MRLILTAQEPPPVQASVLGTVDHTHAASSDFGDNPVLGYGLADHRRSPPLLIQTGAPDTIPYKLLIGKVLLPPFP
jgi:hypothetical protein